MRRQAALDDLERKGRRRPRRRRRRQPLRRLAAGEEAEVLHRREGARAATVSSSSFGFGSRSAEPPGVVAIAAPPGARLAGLALDGVEEEETNGRIVADAVLRIVGARAFWSERQRTRSCETVASAWRSAGDDAIVSTVCSTLSSASSSSYGDCARAISCEITAGIWCGASADCEIIRCTAPSAICGSVSDFEASASMKGISTSCDAATAAPCSPASRRGSFAAELLRQCTLSIYVYIELGPATQ